MRPKKDRCVKFNPGVTYFKPRGIPLVKLREATLTVSGLEALRLADALGMSHEEAGKSMKVSRAIFGRILEKARKNVAEALLFGKAIKIEGGTYELHTGENIMMKAMILCDDKKVLSELAITLEENNIDIEWAKTGELALSMIVEQKIDLLITYESLKDMTGIELVKKVVLINPMINCVIASKLSSKDFHEATEGLGVLMRLPLSPSKEDAEKLLSHLNKALGK
ncbi:MAG: DUF134 domain-containing protein [Deltaproteobacteria bacterium]|nr:DUF134 domain-containing protein [Deltaproteobacteria bacterium]